MIFLGNSTLNPRRLLAAFACLLALGAGGAHAQPKKVLHVAFPVAETGFDPQRVDDRYSVGICENLYEPLLTYDYLARPAKLVPLAAEAVPEAQENGTCYTFRIRPGILFADDPAFKGKKRELTAKDVEYSIKRFRDPKNRSPYAWLFEDKLVGLDELAEKAKKADFDYDAKIAGLDVRDRYSISFKLKEPDYNFLYVLAMPNVVPVAREVIEMYGADTHAHPVGTGPFILKEWVRRSKIVLEKNPNHRGYELDTRYADPKDEWDRRAIEQLRAKRLPALDRVEIYPIEDNQPRFLAFLNKEHDLLEETPLAFIHQVLLPSGQVVPALAKQGVRAFREEQPEVTYDAFNIDDPILGGYSPERVGLRRALVLAHDRDAEIAFIRKDQAIAAQTPVAPGVVGYDPDFKTHAQDHDPAKAKALLDMFGYVDRDGDGWRETPDGRPLTLNYKYSVGGDARPLAELWVKSLAEIGIRVETTPVQFSDLLKDKKVGKFQIAGSAWIADYPDAQNFLQLLYGPYTGQSNESRFKLSEYDRLYEKSLQYPDGPERNTLYREMDRLVLAYAPWRLGVHRIFNHLVYPWVLGYKKHPILYTNFKYLDLDIGAQQVAMK